MGHQDWGGWGGLVGNTKSSKISHIRTWNWGGVEQDGITANFSRWIGNLFTLLIFPSAYGFLEVALLVGRSFYGNLLLLMIDPLLSPFLRKTCLSRSSRWQWQPLSVSGRLFRSQQSQLVIQGVRKREREKREKRPHFASQLRSFG